MSSCPDCGADVAEVAVPGGTILVDFTTRGASVLHIDGRGVFLQGSQLAEARRAGLPLRRRHRPHCANFWGRLDMKPVDAVPDVEGQLCALLLGLAGLGPTLIQGS